MPASFVTGALGQRHVDSVWRMDVGDGWPWLCLILEFQSSVDGDMSLRALDYSVQVWRALDRGERGPNGELPPVIVDVLHTGERRWNAAISTRELFGDLPEEELRHVPRHEFLLHDLRLIDPRGMPPDNVVAWIVRLEQAKAWSAMVDLYRPLADLLEEAGETRLRDAIVPLIERVLAARLGGDGRTVDFKIPRKREGEMSARLVALARRLGDELNQEWLEKGIRQGRAEGERELACSLAARRFGPEAAEELRRALDERSDPGRVTAAAAMVFECGSVDELMAKLARRMD